MYYVVQAKMSSYGHIHAINTKTHKQPSLSNGYIFRREHIC